METALAIAPLLRDIGIFVSLCTISLTRILPLISDTVNKREVRIIKAKKQQGK